MTLIESRLWAIEDRLGVIERDMAIIKTRLEQLPGRWTQLLAVLAILIPLYTISASLLWTVIHR